jgi:DNA adenine methylase
LHSHRAVTLQAPFPYFGGKRRIAHEVWAALGNVDLYVEPFFGSGAVLLSRPHAAQLETVNDFDGLLANFWRAIQHDPDAAAHHADWPCNEADLHARHLWLVGQRARITERLMGDPAWFDAQAAGWWVWGLCNKIGGGWCSGEGPWQAVDGVLTDTRHDAENSGGGGDYKNPAPLVRGGGQGNKRSLPRLPRGVGLDRACTGGRREFIRGWFADLAARLRDVRVACGDWTRVTGPSVLSAGGGIAGVFLDPPYVLEERAAVYACETGVAKDVLAWCADNGSNPALRIVLAGYDGEHNSLEPLGWRAVAWKATGGYGNQGDGRGRENAGRERLWISPHCIGAMPDLLTALVA